MPASPAELDWLKQSTGAQVVDFYAALGVGVNDRGGEESSIRCFANQTAHNRDDRNPSCSINLLTGLWHCKGCGASGNAFQAAQMMGRSDVQAADLAKSYGVFLEVEKPDVKMPTEPALKRWHLSLQASEPIVRRLGELRGWTLQGIVRCGLGWDGKRIVFPIREPKALKCVGVVRYLPGAERKSLADRGSKRLLFPAPEVTSRRRPLFIVEGEPDAVAVWSCGFQAVAVPGTGSWKPEWGQRLVNRRSIVLADCDTQGRGLARRIAEVVSDARVIELDSFRDDGFDIGSVVAEASREGGLWQARSLLRGLTA